jgi:hypothetical protein
MGDNLQHRLEGSGKKIKEREPSSSLDVVQSIVQSERNRRQGDHKRLSRAATRLGVEAPTRKNALGIDVGESPDEYLRRMVQEEKVGGTVKTDTSADSPSAPPTPRLGSSERFDGPSLSGSGGTSRKPHTLIERLRRDREKEHEIDTRAIDRDVAAFADRVGYHDFAAQLRAQWEKRKD